ncbi:MAG: hypothetical protein IKU22_01735 [Alistipes sp.]|nr:hypothetical protein [Alistipes sp.]
MRKEYNRRAEELAEKHSCVIKSVVKDILSWLYSFFVEPPRQPRRLPEPDPQSQNATSTYTRPTKSVNRVEVVAFFVSPKGERICQHLKELGYLEPSITRDLYSYTEYMWSGLKNSSELNTILDLFASSQGESTIPQMDFFIIVAPVVDGIMAGISREDTANRIALFETLCKNNVSVKVSNRIAHNKLPKNIVYTL